MTTKLTRLPKRHATGTGGRVTMLDAHSGSIAVIARVPNPENLLEVIP